MSEHLSSQIASLKAAYGTLADVLVEEVTALRRDVQGLQESESRTSRSVRNSEGTVVDARRDALRAADKAEVALATAKESELSTTAALTAIRGQLVELSSRCGAAEARAKGAEQSAADAHASVHSLQRENAELRARLDALRQEQDRRCDSLDAAVDRAQAMQRDAQAAVSSSLGALSAAFDRGAAEASALSAQAAETAGALAALRAHTADADTALAKDVAMLNDGVNALRAQQASDAAALVSRIKATADATREAVRQEAEERERRLGALGRKAAGDADDLRRALTAVDAGVQRARGSLEEHERAALSDSRAVGAQVAGLEASVHAQAAEAGRRLDDLARQHGARLDALANAVHAFANVLNLGQVVVDPKAILSRATTALRSGSPERHGGGGGGGDLGASMLGSTRYSAGGGGGGAGASFVGGTARGGHSMGSPAASRNMF